MEEVEMKPKPRKNWHPVGSYPSIAMAAKAMSIHPGTLGGRLRRGWSDHEALYTPVGPGRYINPKKRTVYQAAWISKQEKAKHLRDLGLTYKRISIELHCSESKAHDLVNKIKPAYS
jgi:hypothetical protein